MEENKIKIISKLFEGKEIRTVWDKEKEKYFISVVDVVGILSESVRPRKYWADLKKRLIEEGHSELSEKIGQLKLKSPDGKYRLTDVCDIEEMFRIIESVPSKNAEPIKQWLARLGSERVEEVFDPSIGIEKMISFYKKKGYSNEWIKERVNAVINRNELTEVWKDGGIEDSVEYAILTNIIYKEWSSMTAKEYKEYKGLRKENLRDNMSPIEILLTDLGEETTKELTKEYRPFGLEQNKLMAEAGGNTARMTKENIEMKLGKKIVTSDNFLNYEHIDQNLIDNKQD